MRNEKITPPKLQTIMDKVGALDLRMTSEKLLTTNNCRNLIRKKITPKRITPKMMNIEEVDEEEKEHQFN